MNFLKVLKQVEIIIKGEKYIRGTKSNKKKKKAEKKREVFSVRKNSVKKRTCIRVNIKKEKVISNKT